MRVRICGKYYTLRFTTLRKHNGLCDRQDVKSKQILIRSSLRGRKRLDILIHEMLHAGNWHISEENVSEMATDISRVLWRLGYRDGEEESSG